MRRLLHNLYVSAWLPEVLPVASALVGVAVANRGAARRDTVARLWGQRVETYLAVAEWAYSVDRQVADRDPEGECYRDLPQDAYRPMKASEALSTRIMAFGSNQVIKEFIKSDDCLTILVGGFAGVPPHRKLERSPYRDCQINLCAALSRLTAAIQEELRNGRLKVPVTNSIRRRSYWLMQRLHASVRRSKDRYP
jgi:hypothetical protein